MNQGFYSEMRKMAEPPPPKGWSASAWDKRLENHPPTAKPKFPAPKEKRAAGVYPSVLAEALGNAKAQQRGTDLGNTVMRGLGTLGSFTGALLKKPLLSFGGSTVRAIPGIRENIDVLREGRGVLDRMNAGPQSQDNLKGSVARNVGAELGGLGLSGLGRVTGIPRAGLIAELAAKPLLRTGLRATNNREGENTISIQDADQIRKREGVNLPLYAGIPGERSSSVIQGGSMFDNLRRYLRLGPALQNKQDEERLYRHGGVVVPLVKSSSAWPAIASCLVK